MGVRSFRLRPATIDCAPFSPVRAVPEIWASHVVNRLQSETEIVRIFSHKCKNLTTIINAIIANLKVAMINNGKRASCLF